MRLRQHAPKVRRQQKVERTGAPCVGVNVESEGGQIRAFAVQERKRFRHLPPVPLGCSFQMRYMQGYLRLLADIDSFLQGIHQSIAFVANVSGVEPAVLFGHFCECYHFGSA